MALAEPQIKAGLVKALAVPSPQRSQKLPNVPTVAEAGYEGYSAEGGYGLFVPSGTPAAAIAKLNTSLREAMKAPAVRKALINMGTMPAGTSTEEHAEFMKRETQKWTKIVRQAGMSNG